MILSRGTDVTYVKGVGDALAAKLRKLKINTVGDLVDSVPRKYIDYSKLLRVSQITPGPVTIKVTIGGVNSRYSKKGLHMTEATASDETGSVKLVWFNQPYRAKSLEKDESYYVSGEFAQNYRYFAITNPTIELVSSFPVHTARLVPVYRLTKGLGAGKMRSITKSALDGYTPTETLPKWLLADKQLIPKSDALQEMHFPTTMQTLDQARYRLGFEEILELTLASELNKQEHKSEHSLQIPFDQMATKRLVASLPFSLTDDQRKVAWQIFQDMELGRPMNRLVEGDVGSGKTVVAVLASVGAMQAGFQVAFMAPTEILANQHAELLSTLLQATGHHEKLVLLTGSMTKKQKDAAKEAIQSGKAQMVVGTHALFQDTVEFHKLGLIIVDEQHRFGVEQRKKLQAKAGTESESWLPHVLHMTATPIPRSLALTLYGELDVSVIAQMPPGRKPVETTIDIPENRPKLYKKLSSELDAGRQAFVVCPQIEEDEAGRLSAKKIYDQLSKKFLAGYRVALIHGKMKSAEKDAIMADFVSGKTQVLVSTTVIEVGVNVPNASVMVIEGADRFGLAQIHQLRGRVGRGADAAYCYLVLEENKEPSKRLKLLERETNGFKLAEYDLEIRGPGAIYGTMQHGELDLRVAKLSDVQLIESARNSAKEIIKRGENLLDYPSLNERVQHLRTITNLN